MSEKVRNRRWSPVLVLAGALVLGACGGDDGGGGQVASGELDGATLFESTSPSCASCHVLEAAGSTGRVGPNLTQSAAPAEFVEAMIRQGPGAMPSFEGQLSDEQISALADYVAENNASGS